jgi:hypothetical protein
MTRCPRCGKSFEADVAEESAGSCDDCGTELVTEGRPAVALPSYTEVAKVYEARDETDLRLVRAMLEGADIPVFAYGEHLRNAAYGAVPEPPRTLLVPLSFARRAIRVLHDHGVLKPAPVERDELTSFWSVEVVPALAGAPASGLAASVSLRPEPFRTALFGALEAAGPRGLEILQDLALALAVRGPRDAAREAAGYLAACEAFRERRVAYVAALGAIASRGADADLAGRAIAALERFRGSTDAERAIVPLLDHADAGVRDAAIEALFSLSGGETLGYEPDAPAAARREAILRWWDRVGRRPR